jgi:hypothetical protein
MDHQEKERIKHINRMKSKRIAGISRDRSPKERRGVGAAKEKIGGYCEEQR